MAQVVSNSFGRAWLAVCESVCVCVITVDALGDFSHDNQSFCTVRAAEHCLKLALPVIVLMSRIIEHCLVFLALSGCC
jgi:hypothetical protein